jgi:hypothetical protein
MKKRYEGGGEIDAMEEANNRSEMTPRRVSLPPRALKEMGDASAAEEAGQFGDAGSSRTVKATPKKAAPKPAAKAKPKLINPSNIRSGPRFDDEGLIDPSNIRSGRREFEESQIAPVDKTKMSVSERAKASRESARAGSGTTDRRSVGERLKSAFGMKSGGSVGSASKRADGCATKGKTRGKYI